MFANERQHPITPPVEQRTNLDEPLIKIDDGKASSGAIVRLVGAQALPDRQRWMLDAAHFLKEGFLQQSALHPVDANCVPAKQFALLRLFVELYQSGQQVIESGVPLARVRQLLDVRRLIQMKESVLNDQVNQISSFLNDLKTALGKLVMAERKV